MTRAIRLTLAALCVLTSSAIVNAQNTPPTPAERIASEMAVGRRYLTAMMATDHATLGTMLAPDAVFEDPLTTITGRDAILAAWTKQKITLLSFEEQYAFHSGLTGVVFGGLTKFEQTFGTPSGEDLTLAFAVRTTLVIRVRGDLVTQHSDHVDIGAFNTQLQAHIKRLQGGGGPRPPWITR